MKIKSKLLVCLLLFTFIIGCGNSTPTKPDDVRQEIWDEGIKYYNLIQGKIKQDATLTDDENEQFMSFINKYSKDKNITENERFFLSNILDLALYNLEYNTFLITQNQNGKKEMQELVDKQTKLLKDKYNL